MSSRSRLLCLMLLVSGLSANVVCAQDQPAKAADFSSFERSYLPEVRPLLTKYCFECHAGERVEADLNLADFADWGEVRRNPQVWQKVGEMFDSDQMPPKDAKQPTDSERAQLRKWVHGYLTAEAQARAGDPGRVVLRRLNNAEYTYTIRDLTGVATLDPAREFPVDGAAGEGFTNTGNALVMSPALVTKYLDAGKDVASHAVLLPNGIRFSPETTRSDWTNETLARIRQFYAKYSDQSGGDKVNLQGIVFDTNQGGRLPLEKYLAAAIVLRDRAAKAASGGAKAELPATAVGELAKQRGLSPKYLQQLWQVLQRPDAAQRSPLLDGLRTRWQTAKEDEAPAIAQDVARWQQTLWRFTSVGHIGKVNGPKAWMEAVTPITARQEFKMKLPAANAQGEVVLYLTTGDAGDGREQDFAIWERPRLVAPGRPDLLLRDVRAVTRELAARRDRMFASAAACLTAAGEAQASSDKVDVAQLAKKHQVDAEFLAAWLDYLGIGVGGAVKLGEPVTRKAESASGYAFIQGWVGDDALSIVANSSDQHVRIPGNMKPHGVAVHPAPTKAILVGWRSPMATTITVSGAVQHAHPECGNGVSWLVELRRGNTRQRLAAGNSQGAAVVPFGPTESITVQAGDVVTLSIGPRGDHSCDLTAIDLTLKDEQRTWNLAQEISPNILAGNPHADALGNKDVWHFFSEPASGATGPVIPSGSVLAKWQSAPAAERPKLAGELQNLLREGVAKLKPDAPDAALYGELTSLGGPLMSAALRSIAAQPSVAANAADSPFGLDPALFGQHPNGTAVEPASLVVQAPAVLEVRLPASLVAGAEFVATGTLHAETSKEGSVQFQVLATKPENAAALQPANASETKGNGPWTSNNRGVAFGTPVVALDDSAARKRIEAAFDQFRQLFPPALCYTKIVPVDEVVTLTLFYREDDHLKRLMLDDEQAAQLDRIWDEMHFISQDALTLVDAYAQLMEYATQDADPKVFEPLRKPINDRAAAFRQKLIETEPKHLAAAIEFAQQAYRRPLRDHETQQLRDLYASLRKQEIPHDESIRLLLARVLVAPAFLYRTEKPVPGDKQGPITDWELASRLSYFLWSTLPDDELRRVAASGKLRDRDVLIAQTRRMLADPKARRLATEFTCQWLHIHDFDHYDEKSEQFFPTFPGLREAMYEESIRFFLDLFQNNRPVLSLIDADYTFLNESLAQHYGIPWTKEPGAATDWRRVEGVKKFSRGGILTQATTLAKQAGASRTSPILRGNWLSEVVLGDKLPKPPKGVPPLAETPPSGLTERQLIEQHSADESCAKCHVRIDPYGFALENFDAIGRFRQKDSAGLAIDSKTTLVDGTKVDGLEGLKKYILTTRREAFVRQFSKKLLGYSLGRSVQLSDEPLLTEMRNLANDPSGQVGRLVELIVLSPQFREIRGSDSAYED